MSVFLWSAEKRSKPMESVYETEQPLEEVVEETESAEEGADTYQELLDILQTLTQNEEGETAALVEVSEVSGQEEPDVIQVVILLMLSVIVGILLVRTLLERIFV